ncbi:hypothetical protein IAE60_10305 [Pseudoxanthomonas mexicana]|uniref:Uncharacterized protein n=1 Tax=Pseudoxanthomonas mexicana TaxID=128785 RepID=A0A7G9T8D1_PSEMX|nr:hypothetical protein [Pseudoxanthomonas mexicana]QNN76356.1 hypothetical protein IAE60_10305 [Pseudoxanthomonas mexicana]
MGPITLYDKSFLEALNLDEAVMFDYFFYPLTCPVFYVETLANLAKAKKGRSPDELVGAIAKKFPQIHGGPNVHHRTLAVHSLCGGDVPMRGQIVVAGGIPVDTDGKNNIVFKQSPEASSFARWQHGEFEELEREFAQGWRNELANLDLDLLAQRARNYGIDLGGCKQIEDCRDVAISLVDKLQPSLQLAFSCELLNMSADEKAFATEAWGAAGRPTLREFAPYAHYVTLIQVFFDIALATGKISKDRPSNFNDMAYLYYMPFCSVFVSSDKLHRRCAPLFMRDGQQFVWGEELKADLRIHNEALLALPKDVRDRGLIRMAPKPIPGSMIADIHQRAFARAGRGIGPVTSGSVARASSTGAAALQDTLANLAEGARGGDGGARLEKPVASRSAPALNEQQRDEIHDRMRRIMAGAEKSQGIPPFDSRSTDSVTIERLVDGERGSWVQISRDMR